MNSILPRPTAGSCFIWPAWGLAGLFNIGHPGFIAHPPVVGKLLSLLADKTDAVRRTDIVGAGRDEPLVYAVVTEVAFVGDVPRIIKIDGIIGAGIDTGLAAGAQIVIHDDNAVVALLDGFLRAHVGTGGIVAMPAQVHPKAEFQSISI